MPSNVWKESLSIDDHQCHQHHGQSPLILTELSEHKKATRDDIGNPDPCVGQGHKCGRVKPDDGITTPVNWISNDNTYITYWFAIIFLVYSQ